MDVMHFVHDLNNIINKRKKNINLENIRQNHELTRKQLSFMSGVPIRTIEQYEQRRNKEN